MHTSIKLQKCQTLNKHTSHYKGFDAIFWEGSLAEIKLDLNCNLFKPAAAENYPSSRNKARKLAQLDTNYSKIQVALR